MHRLTQAIAGLAFVCLNAGCFEGQARAGTQAGEATGKLVVTGSSTVAPLVLEIAKRFETLHPDVRIDVQTGGSSRGIADAGSGLADIGMASRPLDSNGAGRAAGARNRSGRRWG